MSLVVLVVIVLCETREFPLQLCCPSCKEGSGSSCMSHERGEACDGSPWAWSGLAGGGVDPANTVLCDHCLIVGLGVPAGTFIVGTGQRLLQPLLLPLPRVEVWRVAHVVIHKRVLDRLLFALTVCGLVMEIWEGKSHTWKIYVFNVLYARDNGKSAGQRKPQLTLRKDPPCYRCYVWQAMLLSHYTCSHVVKNT